MTPPEGEGGHATAHKARMPGVNVIVDVAKCTIVGPTAGAAR